MYVNSGSIILFIAFAFTVHSTLYFPLIIDDSVNKILSVTFGKSSVNLFVNFFSSPFTVSQQASLDFIQSELSNFLVYITR